MLTTNSDSFVALPEAKLTVHFRRATLVFVAAALVSVAAACGRGPNIAAADQAKIESTESSGQLTPGGGPASQVGPINMICSAEGRGLVAKQLTVGSVSGDQSLVTTGADHSCTYTIGAGSLVMMVHQAPTASAASAYLDTQRNAGPQIRVTLLGDDAFTRSDGTTITLKDNLVLIVDPTNLPEGNANKRVAQALSFAILACWTG